MKVERSSTVIFSLFIVATFTFSNFTWAQNNPYGLEAMRQFHKLPYIKHGIIAMQESSRDREGFNRDGGGGHFLYMRDAENVMADIIGPGVIYRIWLTGYQPNDRMRFYFDGENNPRIDETIENFFAGTNAPFLAPLCVNDDISSGGFCCYLPFPFEKSLVITTTGDSYYNITYHKLEPGSPMSSWTGNEDTELIRQMWIDRGKDPKPNTQYLADSLKCTIPAGNVVTLFDKQNGPQMLSQLLLKIEDISLTQEPDTIWDHGREHRGSSEFFMKINPRNNGVTLIRRLDYSIPDQVGDVYVDDQYVGQWSTPEIAVQYRWLDSPFQIPAIFTQNKSQIKIKINFVSSGFAGWIEFYYWMHSNFTTGEDNLTDELDVGDEVSEQSHSYSISGETWWGYVGYTYKPQDPNQLKNSNILANTFIRIYWDNETTPSVDAPLGLFFGTGTLDLARFKSIPIGFTDNNFFYSYWPMPYKNSAIIQLVNESDFDLRNVDFICKYVPFNDSFENVGLFKTYYHKEFPTSFDKDYLLLNTTGTGHYVGVVLTVISQSFSSSYLEGDERFYVDDALTPWIYGTGTEDYFNGGWYFDRNTFDLAVHGYPSQIEHNRTMYRFHLSDAVPFFEQGKFGIEHGYTNDVNRNYHSLAFYYLQDSTTAIKTDELNIGSSVSEQIHKYKISGQTWTGKRTFQYEGDDDTQDITDIGRQHRGTSEFQVLISPENRGVRLLRRFDYGILNQQAEIYVDDVFVGTWRSAGSNPYKRWRDEFFMIPARLTTGKKSINIRINASGAEHDWTEFHYWIYSMGGKKSLVAPMADFAADFTAGQSPLTVHFTDLSIGDIISWNWNFGDDQASTEQNPTHTYQQPGLYTVSLYVSGPTGSDTNTRKNFIIVADTVVNFVTHDTGNLQVSVFGNGNIGHLGGTPTGDGVKFKGSTDVLYSSGLILGTKSRRSVNGHLGSFSINEDLITMAPI
ncbi:DUF2961 domain-containing protein, partial [candidate division KSB1 bacterium]|nr:DUF2961 domain-containing protein [candidate division KSB1 bacterium]